MTGVSLVTIAPTFANVASKPTTLLGAALRMGILTTAQQFTAQQNVTMSTLTYAATVNTNCNLSNVFVAATGNFTLANPTNPGSGGCYVWFIKQDAAGSRLITFGSKFKFAWWRSSYALYGFNAMDRLGCTYDATNDVYYCSLDKGFA